MNISAVRPVNFRSWSDPGWIEIPRGTLLLSGRNGAGKTTLVDGMLFALYGVASDAGSLIQRGCDLASFGVVLETEQGTFRITRNIKRSGSKAVVGLQVVSDDESLTCATVSETQKMIDALIPSEGVLRASAFSTQHGGAAFTEAAPRDRKRIFGEILALGMWDRLHEDAKSEQRDARAIAAAAKVRADQLAGSEERLAGVAKALGSARADLVIAEQVEKDAEAEAARLAAEAEAAREARRQHAAAAEAAERARADHARAAQERAAADEALARARSAAANAPSVEDAHAAHSEAAIAYAALDAKTAEARAEAQRHAEQLAEARRELASAAQAREFAEAEESNLRARYAAASANACPECGQELVTPDAQAIVGRLAEQHTAARLGVESAADAVETWDARIDYLVANAPVAPDEAPLRKAREATTMAAAKLAEAETIQSLAGSIDTAQQRARDTAARESDTSEIAYFADETALEAACEVERTAGDNEDHDRATAALAAARLKHREAAAALATAEAAAQHAERDANEEATARTCLAEATQREAVASILAAGFGPTGVPALVIDNVLGQLADEANRVLAELGTPIRCDLRSQRVTQKGDLVDALDIIVLDGPTEAPYETLSGGERTRVALALRAALTRLLAAKSGARVRILVVDEPQGLDAAGAEAFADVLQAFIAAGIFETCIVVTHDERLADRIDRVIRIEKSAGGASRMADSAPPLPASPPGSGELHNGSSSGGDRPAPSGARMGATNA